MKNTILPALAVLCIGAIFAFSLQSRPQKPPVKQDRAPVVPEGVTVHRDIAYVAGGQARQKLDLYLPKAGGPLPLIINIHGGAFRMGSKEDGVPVEYLSLGYAVASIGYRLSGDAIWPAQIEDCKAAVRWLRANARTYGIDPDRFAAWGASAGGHLAAMLGTAGGVKEFEVGENLSVSSRVQAVVDYFGPTDFLQMDAHRLANGQVHDPADSPESQLIGGALQQNKDKAARANPITYVTRDAPPFLICHGDADPLVPHHQSVLLEAALRRAGVPVTFYTVTGAGHGRFNDPRVPELTKAFLAEHLKPAARSGSSECCVLETSLGTMAFELFEADAPKTAAQFKSLVRKGFYDGKDFYRVVRGHVIQTGGGDAPKLPPEFNARPHVFGTLGLGRTGDEWSGDSEFYVCVAARPYLDGKYTVFGRLVEGAAVLEKIAVVPVEEKWEGADRAMAMHKPVEPRRHPPGPYRAPGRRSVRGRNVPAHPRFGRPLFLPGHGRGRAVLRTDAGPAPGRTGPLPALGDGLSARRAARRSRSRLRAPRRRPRSRSSATRSTAGTPISSPRAWPSNTSSRTPPGTRPAASSPSTRRATSSSSRPSSTTRRTPV